MYLCSTHCEHGVITLSPYPSTQRETYVHTIVSEGLVYWQVDLQASQLRLVLQSFDFLQSIALQPETLQTSILLQVLYTKEA